MGNNCSTTTMLACYVCSTGCRIDRLRNQFAFLPPNPPSYWVKEVEEEGVEKEKDKREKDKKEKDKKEKENKNIIPIKSSEGDARDTGGGSVSSSKNISRSNTNNGGSGSDNINTSSNTNDDVIKLGRQW